MKKLNILIMTATISPPADVPYLTRTNPEIRLKDYEKALEFYSSLVNRRIDYIVFAENSNSDVSALQKTVQKQGVQDRTEFLVFDGLDYPAAYGRAYSEFKLIDYTMSHSKIIQTHGSGAVIWKVIGRYLIRNLSNIISNQPSNFDLYCNFRRVPKPWADMYLLAWSSKGHQRFLRDIYLKLTTDYDNSPTNPEELFINLLDQKTQEIKLIRRINPAPIVDGVKGVDNKGYLEGRNLLKSRLRGLGRKLLPWLWI